MTNGSLTPAALIPFCAYQTAVSPLGQNIKSNIPFPVCDKFKPILLQGQLCYSLNLSRFKIDKTKSGVNSDLLLIIDPGNANMYADKDDAKHVKDNQAQTYSPKQLTDQGTSAKIYLNTLSSFTAYTSGRYTMSVLKKMTGTENFLALPDTTKNCQIELLEECQVTRYIEEMLNKCSCVPWAFKNALTKKVMTRYSTLLKFCANKRFLN
jgi:hypothetical protein